MTTPVPPLPVAAPSKPHPLIAPLDVSRITKEAGVKDLVKRLLNFHGWYWWMPAANGFGTTGVHDFNAVKNGMFIAIETKFGSNKPTAMQRSFAGQIIANDCYAFCVNERNIDHLAMWLESLEHSIRATQEAGGDAEAAVPQEHGARMLNAISVLTDLWQGPKA